jgi:hypothetical protein
MGAEVVEAVVREKERGLPVSAGRLLGVFELLLELAQT